MTGEIGWYAVVNGEKRGPMSSVALKDLVAKGEINRASLVGAMDWLSGLPQGQ